MTRKKEGLASLKEGEVKMYLCGITPYNEPHLGHARCYLTLVVRIRPGLTRTGQRLIFSGRN
ncbi:TPA: hypothetical protein DCX15_05275 [bacterium]|nr:hypothetical protein [bacterium]